MKKRILITLFAALLFSFSISAQILKGHVYDATTNEPLAGASVTYKLKDTQGVVTDINGAYEVHLPAGGVDLVFSYVGYEDVPMPIVISKGDIMQKDVYMKESTNLLEDVVVSAGRFEQKLSDVTVSMDLIKASDIARQAPTDITSTLQTIPGVDIIDKQPSIRGGGGWTYSVGARSLVLVDGMSVLISKFQEEDNANPKAFKYIMWITGIVFILIAPENGSTAALLFGVVFLMMVIGRVPWKQLAKLMGIAGVMVAFFVGIVMIMPTHKLNKVPMMHRVETWQNRIKGFFEDKEAVPAAKYDIDKDAQIAHANIAIASSNIIGKMPGNSVQRDFLSQAFSDFIFAIIIEELGLLGGAFVVILYIWLLMRAGKIARRSEKSFPAFLVMGIALLLVSQAMLNMMVAVGLFPVTGQPLPLISKGGTSTLINCAYIGMILSVSRYVAEKEEQKAAEQQAQKEAELAAKTERHQEMVAAMQEAITTLPSGDNATTSLPPEENSLPDDLKAMLNAAGKREPEEEI